MVAILLAALGVPLWLVVGMVAGTLYSRHRFGQIPGVFRCKVRLVTGTVGSLKTRWGRVPAYGRWVHDVLLINQGLALIRVLPIPVAGVVTGPDKADPAEIKRLGPAPQVVPCAWTAVRASRLRPANRTSCGCWARSPTPPRRRPPTDEPVSGGTAR